LSFGRMQSSAASEICARRYRAADSCSRA